MQMEPTYYYFQIDANDIDRIFTIEFAVNPRETPDKVLKKTIEVAKSAFSLMRAEREVVQKRVNQYVHQTRSSIKGIKSLKHGEYLQLLSHLDDFEAKQNECFKEAANFHEIKKLSAFLSGAHEPQLQHTDASDSWKYSTYLGLTSSQNTVLINIFEKKKNIKLGSFEIEYPSMAPRFSVNSSTFTMITFEKYLCDQK